MPRDAIPQVIHVDIELPRMAKIVYDEAGEDTKATTVDSDDLDYAEDHWQIHHGDDDYTSIPRERVLRVEMTDPHGVLR